MSNNTGSIGNHYGGRASNPDKVSFTVKDKVSLWAMVHELYITSADVSRIGNIYYVRGLKPGAPINNQKGR